MQNITAPSVFNPRAFYDGKKNLFSAGALKMQGDAAEVMRPRFWSRHTWIAHALTLCATHAVLGQYVGLSTTTWQHPWSV